GWKITYNYNLVESIHKDLYLTELSDIDRSCSWLAIDYSANPNYDGNYPYGAAPKGLWRTQTTDVGSFPPNSFGLYDMHGNVREWCSDKWHDNYSGAPTDGSSWETGGSEYRVRRGGSGRYDAVVCRSANRDRYSAGGRLRGIGFRVALVSAWSPVFGSVL
ncbi:formylglycine-generating enzyme family protein, partial [Microcoleus sp.]|uniref:formylglycine-generating enzyme family protein n=1 Tax=Microcoleus sp. TaxID=44472 RepID=UPI003525EF3E